jgi:VanZ family protein
MGTSINARFKNFLFYWLPVFIYCLLIYIQSSYPSSEKIPSILYFDKILHFAAYAFLGGLLLRALKTLPKKNNLKLVMTLSIVLSALYGISDEIHQHYVPSRNADVIDAMADIIGSIFGVYIYQSIWTKRFLRPRRK